MEIKISEKKEEPLLLRTSILGTISYEAATPTRIEVRTKIAASLNADEALVVVDFIGGSFGQKASTVKAHLYKSKEAVESIVAKQMIARHNPKKEAA